MKRVAVIMGSDSDLPVVSGCAAKLDELGINYEMRVMSAHRTPADVAEFAQNAINVISALLSPQRARRRILRALLPQTQLCPLSAYPSKLQRLTGWMPCLQRCRCPRACPWQRLPSTVRPTPRYLRLKCFRLRNPHFTKSLTQ